MRNVGPNTLIVCQGSKGELEVQAIGVCEYGFICLPFHSEKSVTHSVTLGACFSFENLSRWSIDHQHNHKSATNKRTIKSETKQKFVET